MRLVTLLLAASCLVSCAARGALDPSQPGPYGVLLMAHGGSEDWNRGALESVEGLSERHEVEVAFGMADATSLQEAVRRLEARGVRRIGVVRLFVSGESWSERTRQILGLEPGAPSREEAPPDEHAHHHGHSMAFWRIETGSSFALSTAGLLEEPAMGEVLAERAAALGHAPAGEDVLVLAHGPGDDGENERWLERLDRLVEPVRARGFRRVAAMTLREDWPEKRVESEKRIREFGSRATAEGGRAIVVPFRVHGFGPYAEVLGGLEYASDGKGLLPHAKVEEWIGRQADALARGPFEAPSAP